MNKRGKECTRVMGRFISWKTKVSNQTQNNIMHVIEWNIPIMYSYQSINERITYVGPRQSSIYFCMNQFHKFHHVELRN